LYYRILPGTFKHKKILCKHFENKISIFSYFQREFLALSKELERKREASEAFIFESKE